MSEAMETGISIIESSETQAWLSLIHALPEASQDVFLFPGYARVFEAIYQGKASLFCYKQDDAFAIHVVLRRPVHTLPFFSLHGENKELFDMITPEYCGPVIVCSQARRSEFTKAFWQAFGEFARKENIIAEFGRLSPYHDNSPELLKFVQAQPNRHIVAVDLSLSEDKIMRGFSKGNRGSINKAKRLGVKVKEALPQDYLGDFHTLYSATMERNCAAEFYRFPLSFYEDFFVALRGNISLFIATHENKTIAASIFLYHKDYIHYYFSGSDSESLSLCPNNLLLYEAIIWARSKGFRVFSLGGGYHNSGNDTLFSFKQSFSDLTVPFYTYARVHDSDQYRKLCDEFSTFTAQNNQASTHDKKYFPFYRG